MMPLNTSMRRFHLSVACFAAVLCLSANARAASPTDLTLKVTAASFRVGIPGRYSITVANRGNAATDDTVHLSVTLPAGLSLLSGSGLGWSCSAAGQLVDCVRTQPLGTGRATTVRLKVGVCTAAFPFVTTTFQIGYSADTNSGNNVVSRGTTVRSGQCVSASPAPTAPPGTPPVQTAVPTRTPTPTVQPGNPAAPVVTSFTCNGAAQCTLSIGQPFTVQFQFTDANGNATSWQMIAQRDDGVTSEVGHGTLGGPKASGTVPLQFSPFTCPQQPCRQTTYVFSVFVTDTAGLTSAPATLTVVLRSSP